MAETPKQIPKRLVVYAKSGAFSHIITCFIGITLTSPPFHLSTFLPPLLSSHLCLSLPHLLPPLSFLLQGSRAKRLNRPSTFFSSLTPRVFMCEEAGEGSSNSSYSSTLLDDDEEEEEEEDSSDSVSSLSLSPLPLPLPLSLSLFLLLSLSLSLSSLSLFSLTHICYYLLLSP